ncbi:MAG: hypothetical protein Q8M96_10255, partial [Rubrivivax sp.]|nr:hypothetical protein [Rubrivivax sp.]
VQVRPLSTIEHTVEEAFDHHLLHQVSYGTVLKSERREAHARAAAWLTEHVGDHSDAYLAVTAQHHERAGQHALAADCYDRAAQKALLRPAFKAALQYADSAQEQLALSAQAWPVERSFAAMRRRLQVCDNLGLREEQAKVLDSMLLAADTQGELGWAAEALSGLSLLNYRLGRLDQAEVFAHRGAAAALEADEPRYGALSRGNLAWMATERNELDIAQQHLDQAMALAVQARERMAQSRDGNYEVQMLLIQAEIEQHRHRHTAHASAVERALVLAKRMHSPRLECSCHEYRAIAAMVHADWQVAAEHIDATERIAAEFDLVLSAVNAQSSRGRLHLKCGRWDDAARAAGDAVEAYRAMGYVTGLHQAVSIRAEALWRGGSRVEAVAAWQDNALGFDQLGDIAGGRCTRLRLAEARAASGRAEDLGAALQTVRAELPAMAQVGTLEHSFGLAARLAAWRVLRQADDAQAPVQLALAAAELERDLRGLADSEVRQRVLRDVPWMRDVHEAMAQEQAAGSAGA